MHRYPATPEIRGRQLERRYVVRYDNPIWGFGCGAGFLEKVHAMSMFTIELLECEGFALVQNPVEVCYAGFCGKSILQRDIGPER